jgi:hypothetical protein
MNRQRSLLQLPKFQPKQQFAFDALANEKLLGGATRGGKTSFNKLMLIRLCSAVSNLRSDIFRINLDDVFESYMEGEFSFPELLAPWERDGLVKLTNDGVEFIWNGSGITLKHLGSDRAKSKGQGTPVQIRVYDEATQLMESRFRFLRGWVGMTEGHRATAAVELEKVFSELTYEERYNYFPQIIYTTNPIGPSAGYFRRGFVKAAQRYEIFKAPEDDGGFTRIYVPFKVVDNKFENEEAVRSRIAGLGDDAMVDALLNENWDAPIGDFIREYNSVKHVTPDFIPPEHWIKYRVFDWGHSEPFAVIWVCISDGEPFKDHMGRDRWFRRGAKIVYREWYGCIEDDGSKGIGLENTEIAKGMLERTPETTSGITITDSLPFQHRGSELMALQFMKAGAPLTLGNTARVIGWKALKDQLNGIDGDPMFLITQSCVACQDYLPALQRHKTKPDDAVEDGEATHIADVCRLAAMTYEVSLPKAPVKPVEKYHQPKPQARKSSTPEQLLKQRKLQKAKIRGR